MQIQWLVFRRAQATSADFAPRAPSALSLAPDIPVVTMHFHGVAPSTCTRCGGLCVRKRCQFVSSSLHAAVVCEASRAGAKRVRGRSPAPGRFVKDS